MMETRPFQAGGSRPARTPLLPPACDAGLIRAAALAAALCAALAAPIAAQTETGSGGETAQGYGFAQAGILTLDLEGLNARLNAAGLPGLDESVATWGGAGYGVVGRFHFGAVAHGGLDPAEIAGSSRVGLKGGYGLARAKYRALSGGGLSVQPAVGVGAGALSLQIADLDTPTFGDVLDDPARSSTLSTGLMVLFDVGVALDYRLRVKETEGGGGWGLAVGVEGGYLFAPGETSWTLDDLNDVAGGPDLGIEGFYVWISLGGWGRAGGPS